MYLIPASLKEQIAVSESIVRASLKSSTTTVYTIAGKTTSYLPGHELLFTVHEYLKGSGPDELLVAVMHHGSGHAVQKYAQSAAAETLANRNTTWDGRQAVLFLRSIESYSPAWTAANSPVKAVRFVNLNPHSQFQYSIDTISRTWMPASEASTTSKGVQPSGSGSVTFITDGAKTPHPVISLADLRSEIAEWDATLKAGEGIEGYESCTLKQLNVDRGKRWRQVTGKVWTPYQIDKTLESGAATGTVAYSRLNPGTSVYNKYWASGSDETHFQLSLVDSDNKARNGYSLTLSTARPLPGGVYTVRFNQIKNKWFPCNYIPDNNYSIIKTTVTAPAGTLHEAFFDPIYATSTGEYKADASLGVLKPAGYRKAGDTATTTIHSIAWKAQRATLTTSPGALPANHHIDFIELDGSVSLRLDVDAATTTTSGGKHTHAWRICQQPWHAGDKLMLRIAQSSANLSGASSDATCTTPNPKPTPTPIATSTPVATTTPIATTTPVATPAPTPVPLAAPPKVAGFTASSPYYSSITLSWQSRAGVSKYRVTLLVGIGEWQTVNDNLTGTSYTA